MDLERQQKMAEEMNENGSMREYKHQIWYQNKAQERKNKKFEKLEKEYEDSKKKEKKQLDAEIEYDKWVQRTLEKDLMKKDGYRRKKMRKQFTDQRKEQKKERDREESQARVSQWMHDKGFVAES